MFRCIILISVFSLAIPSANAFGEGGGSIDSLIIADIGGVPQAILIRGADVDQPALLRLHGGPGYPFFPYLPTTGPLKDLEKHFTLIYWEQRGTGASFSRKVRKKSMNTDQFLQDTYEVLRLAKNLLHKKKVYVWGHSWGSNLGLLVSAKYPDEIIAYIGTGQSANILANERSCFEFAVRKTQLEGHAKGIRRLSKIDTTDYTLKDALEVRRWIYTYGGVVFSSGEERGYVDGKILKKIWRTPQYKFSNKMNIILHPYYSGKYLWDDMKVMNFFEQVPRIEVPVYFLLGRHDEIVSSSLAAEYFNMLEAPTGKTLIWFEESAHRPHMEEPVKFRQILSEKILKETSGK